MTDWTQELKDAIIKEYLDNDPTPETSTEIVKGIAETEELSANGVRMVLIQAGVYVKKEETTKAPKAPKAPKAEGTSVSKRPSKELAITELKNAIKARSLPLDEDILDKLTGKAAVYLLTLVNP